MQPRGLVSNVELDLVFSDISAATVATPASVAIVASAVSAVSAASATSAATLAGKLLLLLCCFCCLQVATPFLFNPHHLNTAHHTLLVAFFYTISRNFPFF